MALLTIKKTTVKKAFIASATTAAVGVSAGVAGAYYNIKPLMAIGYVTGLTGSLAAIGIYKLFQEKLGVELFDSEKDLSDGFDIEDLIEVEE